MADDLRILILEDRPEDVMLIERELRRGGIGFTSCHADSRKSFSEGLAEFQPDLVISDYSLPDYDGLEALALVRQQHPDMPFILLSGLIGEERTIEAFGNGVTDVILKNNLVRLVHSVARVIKEIEDRSERLGLEQQLRSLQDEFGRVARATELSELATSIAHEVNQPLAAVVNFIEAARAALESKGQSEEASRLMQDASNQALRAAEIIKRLRTFLSGGAQERCVVHAADLVDDAVRIALLDAPTRGIRIVEQLTAPDALVEVDRVEIQQVLVNLLRNAVDALDGMPANSGPRIEIAIGGDEREVRLSVADNGPGIPPGLRERMFEPFFTSKASGLGIGLAVSRRLAEAHDGNISVGDRPGGGAVISVHLPRVPEKVGGAVPKRARSVNRSRRQRQEN